MKSRYAPALYLSVAMFAVRLTVSVLPFEFLLQHTLPDDAFYYFVIARNLARGLGPTFDGLAPTNGYHPLWLFIILPIFVVLRDPLASIRVALGVAAILDSAAIFLIYCLCLQLRIRRALALLACLLYGLSPLVVLTIAGPLNGLETAVNTLLVTACAWASLRLLMARTAKASDYLLLGVLNALCFLARTDNAILIAVLNGLLLMHVRRQKVQRGYWIAAQLLTGLLIAPWLIYSYLAFGSLVQVSGQSLAFVTRETVARMCWTPFDYILQWLINIAKGATYALSFLLPRTLPEILVIGLAFLFCVRSVRRHAVKLSARAYARSIRNGFAQHDRAGFVFIALIALTYVTFITVHTVRAIELRPWYYGSLVTLLIVALAYVGDRSLAPLDLRGDRRVLTSLLLLMLAIQGVTLNRLLAADRVGELDKWAMVQAMNRTLPAASVVGAWNAGVYGYFFERGTVVNLDGLVNNVAYEYIQRRSLAEYARNVSMEYLVDDTATLARWRYFWQSDPTHLPQTLSPLVEQADITLWRWHREMRR